MHEVLSHYRILSKLGAGGMGEVYLAEDMTLGRRVALKILPRAHTQNEERLRRFRQEAKTVSALNHPNILTIHEVGEADGRHFIATEFIEGETLRTAIQRSGRMETREALNIAVQAASALTAAHESGIVHRDIKPDNIMIRHDGYVKVLDFGLAKLAESPSQPVDANAPTIAAAPQTESGVIVGTMQYMSPEQAAGRRVDARSDIFSFGAVLYEMLTGERPFQRSSPMETVAAILSEEPAPPAVPEDLAKVLLRCLRKDPVRRYQTMADLKVALDDLREEPVSVKRASRAIWIGGALAVLAIGAAVLTWRPWRTTMPAEPLQAVALTTLPGVEAHPSFSPDGNHVVFSWTDPQGNQDLYVQMIGSGSPLRRTTDARHDYNPVWSPDGRWIAFFRSQPPAPTGLRSRELLLIPPLGGSERKIADVRSHDFFRADMYLAWADSKSLVVTDTPADGQPGALFLVSIETGEKRKLTNPQPPVLADTSPAVSSDGRQLVFLRRTSWGAGELHLQPLAPGSESRRLTRADLSADFPAWTPDDREIVFSAKEGLWRMRVAGENEPVRLPYIGEGGVMPAISRAQPGKPARLVYVHSFTDINFWRIETPGLGAPSSSPPVPTAISSTKLEYHIQLSPDGRRAAFTSLRSGDPELWVSDADGSNAVALTSMHARDTNCAFWSPDGRTIAFSSTGDREFDLYVVPATGGAARQLTSHPAIDVGPTFSPDGRWIYFASMRTGDYRIWKMPAGGGDAVQVTPTQAARALEAPDGSLYYVEFSVVSPLWRLRPGGAPEKVLDDILWFNFTIVKNGIYYITPAAGETQLRYLDLATGRSTLIARNLGDVAAGITASPDGKTILYTRIDASVDDLMLVENFR